MRNPLAVPAVLGLSLITLAWLLVPTRIEAQPKTTDKDATQKLAVAKAVTDLAEFALLRNLLTEAKDWLDEALKLAPDYKDAIKLKEKIEKAASDGVKEPTDADKTAFQRKLDSEGKKIARLYYDLYAAGNKAPPKDKPAYEPYLARAYQLDPKAMRNVVDQEIEAARASDLPRALRLLNLAQKVKPDDKFAAKQKELELKLATQQPVLRQCKTHDMAYYLLLPKDWTSNAAKKWPIIVGSDGAGANFYGYCNAYVGARGNLPFIVITPNNFTNTSNHTKDKYPLYSQELIDEITRGSGGAKMKFDEEGVLAAVAEVQKEFNGTDKFFITGFSGGGHITWRLVFRHPEKLYGAVPACGNFSLGYCPANDVSEAPERETLPIRALQGDKDEYLNSIHGSPRGLNHEWADCEALLKQSGYKAYERVMLPGVGHSACIKEVLAFCNEIYSKLNDPKKPK